MTTRKTSKGDNVTEAFKAAELTKEEKLEVFKKEIWDEINRMPWNPSISTSIQITDEAFERMMENPKFKDQMLSLIREDATVGRPPISYTMLNITKDGYSGYSYNFGYGEDAFRTHSQNKDAFYTKKARKKKYYEELWEAQRLEKNQKRARLNNEHYENLLEGKKFNQRQQVAKYEKAIRTG